MWAGEAILLFMEFHPEVKLHHCPICRAGKGVDCRAVVAVSCHATSEQRNRYCAGEIRQGVLFQPKPLFGRSRWGAACRLRYAGEHAQRNGLCRPLCPGTEQAPYSH